MPLNGGGPKLCSLKKMIENFIHESARSFRTVEGLSFPAQFAHCIAVFFGGGSTCIVWRRIENEERNEVDTSGERFAGGQIGDDSFHAAHQGAHEEATFGQGQWLRARVAKARLGDTRQSEWLLKVGSFKRRGQTMGQRKHEMTLQNIIQHKQAQIEMHSRSSLSRLALIHYEQ